MLNLQYLRTWVQSSAIENDQMLKRLAKAKGFQQSALAVQSKAISFMAECMAFPIMKNAALAIELLYQLTFEM